MKTKSNRFTIFFVSSLLLFCGTQKCISQVQVTGFDPVNSIFKITSTYISGTKRHFSQGSGFVIKINGKRYIATALHVVNHAKYISAKSAGANWSDTFVISAYNCQRDLALLSPAIKDLDGFNELTLNTKPLDLRKMEGTIWGYPQDVYEPISNSITFNDLRENMLVLGKYLLPKSEIHEAISKQGSPSFDQEIITYEAKTYFGDSGSPIFFDNKVVAMVFGSFNPGASGRGDIAIPFYNEEVSVSYGQRNNSCQCNENSYTSSKAAIINYSGNKIKVTNKNDLNPKLTFGESISYSLLDDKIQGLKKSIDNINSNSSKFIDWDSFRIFYDRSKNRYHLFLDGKFSYTYDSKSRTLRFRYRKENRYLGEKFEQFEFGRREYVRNNNENLKASWNDYFEGNTHNTFDFYKEKISKREPFFVTTQDANTLTIYRLDLLLTTLRVEWLEYSHGMKTTWSTGDIERLQNRLEYLIKLESISLTRHNSR